MNSPLRGKFLLTFGCLLVFAAPGFAQEPLVAQPQNASPPADAVAVSQLLDRLDKQAAEIRDLTERLDQRDALYKSAKETPCECGPQVYRLPVVAETCWQPSCESKTAPKSKTLHYFTEYNNGLVIRPFCPEKRAFDFKVGGWMQFRHHAFSRDVATWTDNAGVTRPVRNRNAFDIERARLSLSGFVLDPRLRYFIHMDGDTDGSHTVDFFDYFWSWQVNDGFQLQLGKRKVPGSRQWLLGARRTRLIDRPMTNDFFRPDRTVGLFGVGKIGETGHYQVMAGNGHSTANIPNSGTDNHFTYAVTNYFDPWGDFGGQLVDYKNTETPLLRVGHSLVFSPVTDNTPGTPLREAGFARLSDGTVLTQPGALAAGVTVSEFDIWMYSADLAAKWRGWSVNAEAFFRWLQEIEGNGALPVTDIYQRGFYVEGGCFLIPQMLDINVRYSQVSGLFGNASEYAAGFNLYPLDTHKLKVSFDVTSLDGSPLNNTTTDILAGDDGTLFRTQVQAEF